MIVPIALELGKAQHMLLGPQGVVLVRGFDSPLRRQLDRQGKHLL